MWVSGCVLCRSTARHPVADILLDQVFAAIAEQWGAVPEEIAEEHMPPGRRSILYRCAVCGLEYFEPARAGDAAFYEALGRLLPYQKTRWEFHATRQAIAPGSSVVDFGCGDGQFLILIKDRASRAVGVDHNPGAISTAREAGVEAYDIPFEEFAAHNRSGLDVATAFHLIEHVTDVAGQMRPAAETLRKGGQLFVAVPNRDRLNTGVFEPLDFPPHHLSRWSVQQLSELGDRLQLELINVQLEPLDRSWHARLLVRKALPSSPPQVERWATSLVLRLWLTPGRYQTMVNEGPLAEKGLHGHGMLAQYAKP